MEEYYDGYDWDDDGFPGEFVYGDLYESDSSERWKPMPGAPDYWISTENRVWSSVKRKFITGSSTKHGYTDFSLKRDGKRVRKTLHKALGEAFIPNPNNYPEVRHMNDNPADNWLDNLQWGTQLDNVHDCIRNGHFRYFTKEDIKKANDVRRTPVVAVRLTDGKKEFFDSQQEASRKLGIDQSCINAVIRGKSRSAEGYFFAKQEDFDASFDHRGYSYQRKSMPVKAINLNTGETRFYDKPRHAAFDLSVSEASVSNVLRGKQHSAKGWIFKTLNAEDEVDE